MIATPSVPEHWSVATHAMVLATSAQELGCTNPAVRSVEGLLFVVTSVGRYVVYPVSVVSDVRLCVGTVHVPR